MVVLSFSYMGIRIGDPCGFVRASDENWLLDLNGTAIAYWGDDW